MKILLLASLAFTIGCRHHADPRLAGTWDVVVDPQLPPHVGAFATVKSGTFEFGDVNATRTLVVETDDHQQHTIVTRYLDWHIADDTGWFAYTTDDDKHTDTSVMTEIKGDDATIMDMDTLESFTYHRRKPAAPKN